MPASETPTNPPVPTTDSDRPESASTAVQEIDAEAEGSTDGQRSGRRSGAAGYSSSRYIDYDTHELLEKISQYEDERRWQRIREGIWISIIAHILFFAALTWLPR